MCIMRKMYWYTWSDEMLAFWVVTRTLSVSYNKFIWSGGVFFLQMYEFRDEIIEWDIKVVQIFLGVREIL